MISIADPTQSECIVCGHVDCDVLLSSRDRGARGDIVRCPQCAHTFVHPMPSDEQIIAYYNGLYADKTKEFSPPQMELARQSMRGYLKQLSQIHPIAPGSTFLDLGGGLGYYAQAAQEQGLQATLVDLDPCSVEFARTHHSLHEIHLAKSEDFAAQTTRRYQIVFLRHVVEHYVDPRDLIRAASSLLAPTGVLIIETDNNSGIEMLIRPGTRSFYLDLYRKNFRDVTFAGLLRKRPFAVDPPRHLHGFSIDNLRRLMEPLGLKPIKSLSYRLGDPVYWPNIPDAKLLPSLKSLARLNFRAAFDNSMDFLGFPFRYFLAKAGMAAGICIYATKCSRESGTGSVQ